MGCDHGALINRCLLFNSAIYRRNRTQSLNFPVAPGVSDAGGPQAVRGAILAQVPSLLEERQEPHVKNSTPFICFCWDAKCPLLPATGPDVGQFAAQGK